MEDFRTEVSEIQPKKVIRINHASWGSPPERAFTCKMRNGEPLAGTYTHIKTHIDGSVESSVLIGGVQFNLSAYNNWQFTNGIYGTLSVN